MNKISSLWQAFADYACVVFALPGIWLEALREERARAKDAGLSVREYAERVEAFEREAVREFLESRRAGE